MTEAEVERILGYTPCVCGKLDGTWHRECYRGLSAEQIRAAYKRAFAKARVAIKSRMAGKTYIAIEQAGIQEQPKESKPDASADPYGY